MLSQRFQRPTAPTPSTSTAPCATINPSPYMYYLDLGEMQIVGASPEMLVRVEDGKIDYHPIAGTRRRGATPAEDDALEEELRNDEKERAEHVMLLDLGRNDVGRVSEPGTRRRCRRSWTSSATRTSCTSSRTSRASCATGLTSYDALRACFPAGTVSGAPKIRAMEIIAELERDRRGPYAGAVGYFDLSGNLDTAITIRTILMKDGVAHVQSGGGIVYDSDPAAEYAETENKAHGPDPRHRAGRGAGRGPAGQPGLLTMTFEIEEVADVEASVGPRAAVAGIIDSTSRGTHGSCATTGATRIRDHLASQLRV